MKEVELYAPSLYRGKGLVAGPTSSCPHIRNLRCPINTTPQVTRHSYLVSWTHGCHWCGALLLNMLIFTQRCTKTLWFSLMVALISLLIEQNLTHGSIGALRGMYYPLLHFARKASWVLFKLWYAFNTSPACVLLSEQAFHKLTHQPGKASWVLFKL